MSAQQPRTWFGPPPAGWVTPPVYAVLEVQLGKMLNQDAIKGEHFAPYLRNVDVQWDFVNTTDLPVMNFSASERTKFALRRDDLLVCEGGEIGRTAIWTDQLQECYYQKAIHRLRSIDERLSPRYFFYVMRAAAHRGAFSAGGNKSTIEHLTAERLRRFRFPMPSRKQQKRCVRFLDERTAAIDALIEKKERLIKLLQEKRQAIITQAVTKGLDPDVPMKDSGVEWIGEIPEHWDLKRVGALFRETSDRGGEGLPILSVSIHCGVSAGEVPEDALHRQVNRSEDRSKYKHVQPNDLVYNMMRAWQGGFGAVEVEGQVSPAYVVLRPRCNLEASYYERLLRTPNSIENMRRLSYGVADFRLRLYWDAFKMTVVPVPPPSEIKLIASHVRRATAAIEGVCESVERSVNLLRERRQALITAAVTGQIEIPEEEPATQ